MSPRSPPRPGRAWAPADRYPQNGTPHPGCRRRFARQVTEAIERRGLSVRAGIEVEWVVADAAGSPSTVGPMYGMTRFVEHSDHLREVLRALTAQGLLVLQLHPEYAAGQFEVSVAAEGSVEAADTTMLVRHTIRAVSARHGLRVSYAPVVTEAARFLAAGAARNHPSPQAASAMSNVCAALPIDPGRRCR
ncbi:hypothetical protein [Streptomyces sp. NPDC091217]|uniref:hypothetical protein n=1 Tax=Streptomyces sp. NPDC091217 TaxID=3365975 RepID=UPI003830D55F